MQVRELVGRDITVYTEHRQFTGELQRCDSSHFVLVQRAYGGPSIHTFVDTPSVVAVQEISR